jgi:hypothetical protein
VTRAQLDVAHLLTTSPEGLDALFRESPAGDIPRGEGTGTVIIQPGTAVSARAATLIRLLAWQGKVFDPVRGELRNRISPFGVKAIRAEVYVGTSLVDGHESIVLDYSKTSLIAHWVRDEIRLVGPSLYLGIAFWSNVKIINFALSFSR